MPENLLMIVSGPAGSGKNTCVERLLSESPNLERVVTCTSRAPREGERNGIDYFFLSKSEFEKNIESGNFYEWAKVHGNYYGTSKKSIADAFSRGKDLVLIIDVAGAKTWKKIGEENPQIGGRLIFTFIVPPSEEELRKRLRGRGTETNEQIEVRMKTAVFEMGEADKFENKIFSKTREDDFLALKKIYETSTVEISKVK